MMDRRGDSSRPTLPLWLQVVGHMRRHGGKKEPPASGYGPVTSQRMLFHRRRLSLDVLDNPGRMMLILRTGVCREARLEEGEGWP